MTREEALSRERWMEKVTKEDPTLIAFDELKLKKHLYKIYEYVDDLRDTVKMQQEIILHKKHETCDNCEHGHYTDKQQNDIWCLKEDSPVYDCNTEIGFGCTPHWEAKK